MAKINGINIEYINDNRSNMYTKRTCLDNSELYITAKLNKLYEKTLLDRNMFNSKRTLKKMIENGHLGEGT